MLNVRKYGQHFPSAYLARFFNCKLKPFVASITTFMTNLSRSKLQSCKLRQHVAQSGLEFYFVQLSANLSFNLSHNRFQFNACKGLSRSAAMRQIKKNMAKSMKTRLNSKSNLSESHKFAPYKDFEGYHSLSVSSVSSKQATKVKRL